MRLVVHLSDLHFGRVDNSVLEPLAQGIRAMMPHLVIVSGDLTQDARTCEFEQARKFLDSLPQPQLVVPGNHDMAFLNWGRRVVEGLGRYRRYITDDLEPFYADDEIAVMGVNTVRRFPTKGGRISQQQIENVEKRLCSLDPNLTKILVTHHPFDLAETYHHRELVGRARQAMARIARSVDILLAGHIHVSHSGSTAKRYRIEGQSALFVQAGTATSTRGRGEPNAFNVLRIKSPELTLERYQWSASKSQFHAVGEDRFMLPELGTTKACLLPA